jgi:hypothetical protein
VSGFSALYLSMAALKSLFLPVSIRDTLSLTEARYVHLLALEALNERILPRVIIRDGVHL